MKLVIITLLMFMMVTTNSQGFIKLIPIDAHRNIVLLDGASTFKAVAKYSTFLIGASLFTVGQLKDKDKMTDVGINLTMLAFGVIIGDKW